MPGKTIASGVLEWRSEDHRSRVAVERVLFITIQDFLDRAKGRIENK